MEFFNQPLKPNIIIIYLIFLLYEYSYQQNITCENISNIISQNDKEMKSFISSNMQFLQSQYHTCIDTLVKFCKTEVLDLYLNELSKLGIHYKENLEISLRTMLNQIDEVHNKHKYTKEDYQVFFPASKWAQSLDNIFIEVKFAIKYDSPGCLEVRNLKVELKEKSIKLEGYCVLGDIPMKISYYIETYDSISVKESKHYQSSVGRYQFKLKKKKSNNYWKKLLSDKMNIPKNMIIWIEMKEKYNDQIARFENKDDYENDDLLKQMIEQVENKDKKVIEEKKKKKKKKKINDL